MSENDKSNDVWEWLGESVPWVLTFVFLYLMFVRQPDWMIQSNEVSYLQVRDNGFVYEVNSDSKFTGKYVDTYGEKLDCSGVSCLFSK